MLLVTHYTLGSLNFLSLVWEVSGYIEDAIPFNDSALNAILLLIRTYKYILYRCCIAVSSLFCLRYVVDNMLNHTYIVLVMQVVYSPIKPTYGFCLCSTESCIYFTILCYIVSLSGTHWSSLAYVMLKVLIFWAGQQPAFSPWVSRLVEYSSCSLRVSLDYTFDLLLHCAVTAIWQDALLKQTWNTNLCCVSQCVVCDGSRLQQKVKTITEQIWEMMVQKHGSLRC